MLLMLTDAYRLIQNILVASPPDDLDITVTPPPADCSAPGSAIVAESSPTHNWIRPFYFSLYTTPVYPTVGTWQPKMQLEVNKRCFQILFLV
jgi:hypothetical protein